MTSIILLIIKKFCNIIIDKRGDIMHRISYFGEAEAFEEYKSLLREAHEKVKEMDLHHHLVLSAYYQQLILMGYDVYDILNEIMIPTEVSYDAGFGDYLKSSKLITKLNALTNAVYTLRTIGYLSHTGFVYKDRVRECPRIIEDKLSLYKII